MVSATARAGSGCFNLTTRYDKKAGRACTVYEIFCRSCEARGEIPVTTRAGTLAPDVVKRKFTERGWLIGRNSRRHTCPACLTKRETEARMGKGKISVVTEAGKMVKADPPRKPSGSDKRVIILDLEDHYDHDARGYRDGVTDQTIADGLGVPRAWVSDIRDEMFGPAVDSETRAFLDGLAKLDTLRRDLDRLAKLGADIRARLGIDRP